MNNITGRLSFDDCRLMGNPFTIDHHTIVYDGAIYNYQQVRSQLGISKGGDAELILKGYMSWGVDILQKLNGIFSFAIWNGKELFLARDFKGFIPLYYTKTKDTFIFSSEINNLGVEKKVNKHAIFEFLCRSHPPLGETMYENIYELQPATWMKVDPKGSETKKYFSLEDDWKRIEVPKNEKDLIAVLKCKIKESVNRQLASPIGMVLSGGIDSALVFKFMSELYEKPLHAFTYANSVAEINEAKRATATVNSIGKEVKHHILPTTYHDTIKLFDKTCKLLDLPKTFFKYTIPLILLCQLAFNKGFKVLLTGGGSDSLFMGFPRHLRWVNGLLENKNIRDWAEHFYFGGGIDNVGRVERLTGQSRDIAKESLVYKWVLEHQDLAPSKRIALFDQKFYPVPPLGGSYRATAVQVRCPFQDKELVSWVNAIDDSYKLKGSQQKYILKQAAKDLLPEEIINAPKVASSADVMFWINTPEFIFFLLDLVCRENSFSRTYLNFDEVFNLIRDHEETYKFSHLCWCIYSLERWYSTSF